jgi:Zn-dependent metalloprotease
VVVDADGAEHVRFARRFQGLRVIGGDVVVHSRATGELRDLSRTLASAPMLAVQPKLKAADAELLGLSAAHVATGATVTSELVVFAHAQKPALAWDVLYTGETPEGAPTEKHVIVHAHTGKVLDSFDDVMHAAAVGTGHSLFLGTIDIDTDSQSGGFAMRDTTRGGHAVYDLKGKFSGAGTLFTDVDNEWPTAPRWLSTPLPATPSPGTTTSTSTAATALPTTARAPPRRCTSRCSVFRGSTPRGATAASA